MHESLYKSVLVQTERLDSAMVRSTDAARWPLRDDFEGLAPLRHMMEDLSSENNILHLSQPMVVLYMVASICPRACWQGVCRRLRLLGKGHLWW